MKNYILPEYLYKFKPYIYIGLGIYVWIKLETVYAVVSALMLVGAGILALLMRQTSSYQKSLQRMRLRETKKQDEDTGFEDTLQVTIQ